MAQLSTGPRYGYLIEELKGAIAACMFEIGGEQICGSLQMVLDMAQLEPVLGGAAQEARECVEVLLRTGDTEATEARRQRAAGLETYTPLAARMDTMSDEDRRALARALIFLLVHCVEQDTMQSAMRLVGSSLAGGARQ